MGYPSELKNPVLSTVNVQGRPCHATQLVGTVHALHPSAGSRRLGTYISPAHVHVFRQSVPLRVPVPALLLAAKHKISLEAGEINLIWKHKSRSIVNSHLP